MSEGTRNTLTDVHNLLMEQMERLNGADEGELKGEIARSEAMADLATQITSNASTMLKATHLAARLNKGAANVPPLLIGNPNGI